MTHIFRPTGYSHLHLDGLPITTTRPVTTDAGLAYVITLRGGTQCVAYSWEIVSAPERPVWRDMLRDTTTLLCMAVLVFMAVFLLLAWFR